LQSLPRFFSDDALFVYEPPVTKIILDLKFKHDLSHARVLGELLSDHLQNYYQSHTPPEVLIPIPLHKTRLKERGFNQALEIARPVARRLKIPLQLKNIHRIKATQPQATLRKEERTQNMRNAFRVKTNYQHVAVIDDVITTGNTMSEFCRTLLTSGVLKIDIWCIAKPRV
jgi:ComF family protein